MFKTEITSYTLKHTVILINCMVLQHITHRISYFKLKKGGGGGGKKTLTSMRLKNIILVFLNDEDMILKRNTKHYLQ